VSFLLAKALGAIASYSVAHEVPAVRVVFCDAHPYDQGYIPPEDIAVRVKIRGRGGTILMPGIKLLEHADGGKLSSAAAAVFSRFPSPFWFH
jgi:hypothetical protein